MNSFLNPEALLKGKCSLCVKKLSLFGRHTCHLCENSFCMQCCFSSPLLPKSKDILFSGNRTCAVCALAWLGKLNQPLSLINYVVPGLEITQMIKLPTKLIIGLCKAYDITLFASSEKAELVRELSKQNLQGTRFSNSYKNNWVQISQKIKESKNLLPQIENSLRNGNRFSTGNNGYERVFEESSNYSRQRHSQYENQSHAPRRESNGNPQPYTRSMFSFI